MEIADKLTQIANNVPLVYSAGYKKGKEDGGDSYYDTFWDAFQHNDGRIVYRLSFAGGGWTSDILKPKYFYAFPDGTTSHCYQMFERCGQVNRETDGMVDVSFACAKFDFSKCSRVDNLFASSYVKNITVDLSNADELFQTFYLGDGGKIDNLKLKVSAKCTYTRAFGYNGFLKSLNFLEGSEIGQNGLNLQWSTLLDKESIKSVVNALSSNTSGLAVTLSEAAVKKAFETSEGANDGDTGEEWIALRDTKTNWTISLE